MDTHDQHESFIKTPQQLIVVILLAFLVPIFGIIMLVQLVTSRPGADPQAMTPEAVSARLQPVARLEIGGAGGAAGDAQRGRHREEHLLRVPPDRRGERAEARRQRGVGAAHQGPA